VLVQGADMVVMMITTTATSTNILTGHEHREGLLCY